MSFYNLMFGKNSNSDIILAILGLKENDIERYRNCSIDNDGIWIHTRTGGGNREDYPNETLTSHECYLRDEDSDGDSTYADYYFKFPDDIKDDCIKFCDAEKYGIPSSIIAKVNQTFSRPETESDKYTKIYNEQEQVYKSLRYNLDVYETNGHTIVPLSDNAMDRLLSVSEKNDLKGREGEFLPYSIRPYKLHVAVESPKYSFEKDKLCRVKIDLGDKWVIDDEVWSRYKRLFSDKYPKAITEIAEHIKQKV